MAEDNVEAANLMVLNELNRSFVCTIHAFAVTYASPSTGT
jgi:hypothetical protein